MDYTCANCGLSFTRPRKRGPQPRYCSRKCQMVMAPSRRVKRRRDPAQCVVCGAWFQPVGKQLPVCDDICRQVLIRQRVAEEMDSYRRCEMCGEPFVAVTVRRSEGAAPRYRMCPGCAVQAQRTENRRRNVRRRGAKVAGAAVTPEYLGARDGWTCHLCGQRIDARLQHPDPRSSSVDHLVPVADGGMDAPENLALTHLECNIRRGTGGTAQLRLIG